MKTDTIGFIGMGLIGGSIAMKCRELFPKAKIIGMAHSASTISQAFQMGIIENEKAAQISDFRECDLIFLCAPVKNNIEYLKELKDVIKKDCIITDVGSTKTMIHKEVARLGLEENFIGGHPMTGSEKTGIAYANPQFLVNAYYIITPSGKNLNSDVEEFTELVKAFGSIPMKLSYEAHDRATGAISHLPHMIAFSLTNFIDRIDDTDETMKTIAAGSFRDMTRVAASSPAMWESITDSNRDKILELMTEYQAAFSDLKEKIENYKADDIYKYFENAKEYRDSLNLPGKTVKRLVHEIYIDMNDEAGQIAAVATFLSLANINIKNIGIINNREFEEGVLRIEFYEEEAKETAIKILKAKNYSIHVR